MRQNFGEGGSGPGQAGQSAVIKVCAISGVSCRFRGPGFPVFMRKG